MNPHEQGAYKNENGIILRLFDKLTAQDERGAGSLHITVHPELVEG